MSEFIVPMIAVIIISAALIGGAVLCSCWETGQFEAEAARKAEIMRRLDRLGSIGELLDEAELERKADFAAINTVLEDILQHARRDAAEKLELERRLALAEGRPTP